MSIPKSLWVSCNLELPPYEVKVKTQGQNICKNNVSILKKGLPDYWEVSCGTIKIMSLDCVKQWTPIKKSTIIFIPL